VQVGNWCVNRNLLTARKIGGASRRAAFSVGNQGPTLTL
jgi:hypothetical protein